MKKMRFFIDTHARDNGSFPAEISKEAFAEFYRSYEEACRAEGVVSLRTHVSFEDGRAFCFNMAEDPGAIERAHRRVGLSFDEITEVTTTTPGDLFFAPAE